MSLSDRVSIITGAGRGIGKAIAKRFAEEGSIVVLVARSLDEVNNTLKEIKEKDGDGMAIRADISKINDVNNLVKQVSEKYSKIDILVNNAGVIKPIAPIHLVKTDEWEDHIKINIFGT